MKTRDELIEEIHAERAAWQALLAEVGEQRMEEPGPMGDWTFKDLAAHLLAWRERTIARFETGPDGSAPPPAWPASLDGDDEINAWIHEQHRDRPLGDVLADMDRSYERLAALFTTMPEDDLMTPGRWGFEGMEATPLVDADIFGHFHEEHEPSLREWLETR